MYYGPPGTGEVAFGGRKVCVDWRLRDRVKTLQLRKSSVKRPLKYKIE